jgi:xanthine/uracil permease
MTQRDLTQRYLLIFLLLSFVGAVGAFLFYVPLMSAAAVTIIMLGMIGMFVLGFMTRRPRTYRRPSHSSNRHGWFGLILERLHGGH